LLVLARSRKQAEGLVHIQAKALGELALGLLDDDPAVQRGLQLLIQGVAMAHAALVQQADGGHVGPGLADSHASGVKGARGGAEQVQRADDLLAQPHRQGLHTEGWGTPIQAMNRAIARYWQAAAAQT